MAANTERMGRFVAQGTTLEAAGEALLRWSLVAVLLYFGTFKFTAVEAEAIQPLVGSSPFMAWLYPLLGIQGVSNLIGVVEVTVALLLALRPWSATAAAVGGLGALVTFLVTLSFLVTTPGIWERVSGYPLPVPGAAGGFLLKDVFLLGAAVVVTAEALRARVQA